MQLNESVQITVCLKSWESLNRIASNKATASPVNTDDSGGHLNCNIILNFSIQHAAPTQPFESFDASVKMMTWFGKQSFTMD